MSKLKYKEYIKKVTPVDGIFSEQRKRKGIVNNMVKWLAMRFSYIFYFLNFTANFLDIIGIVICFLGYYYLVLGVKNTYIPFAITGVLLIYFHVWIDYIDGALARANNERSKIGSALDDIGCDISRYAMFITPGLIISDFTTILINIFSSVILIRLFTDTVKLIPLTNFTGIILKGYMSNLSFLSVRFMLGVLPIIFLGTIIINANINLICNVISIFYAFTAILWMIICIPKYEV